MPFFVASKILNILTVSTLGKYCSILSQKNKKIRPTFPVYAVNAVTPCGQPHWVDLDWPKRWVSRCSVSPRVNHHAVAYSNWCLGRDGNNHGWFSDPRISYGALACYPFPDAVQFWNFWDDRSGIQTHIWRRNQKMDQIAPLLAHNHHSDGIAVIRLCLPAHYSAPSSFVHGVTMSLDGHMLFPNCSYIWMYR